MEMSTLTTNSINEQFMSTVTELNNNNNICANGSDTTSTCSSSQGSKIASSNGSTAGENETTNPNHSDADSPAHVVQTILSQPDPSPEPVLPTEEPDSLLLPPLIEMPSDPNQGNEMLQNLPKDTSISFPDVSAQTLDENQDVKMVLPEFTDPTSLLNPNAASLTTDPLRTPPRPMIEDRTTVTGKFTAQLNSLSSRTSSICRPVYCGCTSSGVSSTCGNSTSIRSRTRNEGERTRTNCRLRGNKCQTGTK